jgi:soluble lytic murein transglycosylase-like protein
MVSASLSALLLAATTLAVGESPDWSRAGGGLFAPPAAGQGAYPANPGDTMSAGPPVSEPPAGSASVRLPPLKQPLAEEVHAAASAHNLDPKLLHALVAVESAYRADAISPAGAAGLTQLMPATAAELGVKDRYDPGQNLSGGAAYLARQLARFGDVRLALAAYNAGPARVARLGRAPDFAETKAYVAAVIDCYLALTAAKSIRGRKDCRPRRLGANGALLGDRHDP